jgi:hypothetical protein
MDIIIHYKWSDAPKDGFSGWRIKFATQEDYAIAEVLRKFLIIEHGEGKVCFDAIITIWKKYKVDFEEIPKNEECSIVFGDFKEANMIYQA